MIARLSIGLLGSLGLLISVYFTLVYYGLVKAEAPYIPRVCRLEESSCQSLLHRPEARLFWLPNSVLGLVFYLLVIASSLPARGLPPGLESVVLRASAVTVCVSVYLAYQLLAKLRVRCVLCLASHAINACLFLLLLKGGNA